MPRLPLLLALVLSALPASAELPPLLPRELLNAKPHGAAPELSPDGQRLSYLAPDEKQVLQVWVRTLGKKDDRAVTADKGRGIRYQRWAEDGRTLLYLQDGDGDENFHLYGVDLETGNVRDLTPFQGVTADVVDVSARFPHQVLVTLNLRDRRAADVHRLDLRTGALVLDTQNPGDVQGWVVDAAQQVRGAVALLRDGSSELRVRDTPRSAWRTLARAGVEDSMDFKLLGFTADGASAYLLSSVGSDTRQLRLRSVKTGAERVLAQSPKADLSADDVLLHPTRREVQAVGFRIGRREWKVLDPSLQPDFDALAQQVGGELSVVSRDREDRTWLVSQVSDRAPQRFYTYVRAAKRATLLLSTRPDLEGRSFAEMKPVSIRARDGLELPSFLTLPPGVPAKGLPLLVSVHGGPWDRTVWRFHGLTQFFANRGYAVLDVNFRGSTGYGKAFTNAGDKQWGLKMHEDLLDAVDWAVKQGLADPKRVGIIGHSFGGYAALVAATSSPEVFRAAIDSSGPSDLRTLIEAIPPSMETIRGIVYKRVGNPADPVDAERLRRTSPLYAVQRIQHPLLILQGGNDPRVPTREAEQIFTALLKAGKPATYVLYPDEGHGPERAENMLDSLIRMEQFLAQNLGGRLEPVKGAKVPGSSAVVRVSGGATVSAQ